MSAKAEIIDEKKCVRPGCEDDACGCKYGYCRKHHELECLNEPT